MGSTEPRRRHLLAPAAVAVVVMVLASTGAGVITVAGGTGGAADVHADTGMTPHAASPHAATGALAVSPPMLPPAASTSPAALAGGNARSQLLALAGRLRPAPADASRGPYSYLETRQWGYTGMLDANGTMPPTLQRHQWWRSSTGAGRTVTWDETNGCRQEGGDTRHSGGLQGPPGFDGRIAAQPAQLRRQLTAGALPRERTPRHLVSRIMYLPDWNYVELKARATILRLLAELPGLRAPVHTTDRAGRAAVRVAVRGTDSEGTVLDAVLLVDPATGQLLAGYDEVAGEPASQDPGYLASLRGYRLLLDQRRTTSTDHPAAGCAPSPADGR